MRKVTLGTMCWLRSSLAHFSVSVGYAAFFFHFQIRPSCSSPPRLKRPPTTFYCNSSTTRCDAAWLFPSALNKTASQPKSLVTLLSSEFSSESGYQRAIVRSVPCLYYSPVASQRREKKRNGSIHPNNRTPCFRPSHGE